MPWIGKHRVPIIGLALVPVVLAVVFLGWQAFNLTERYFLNLAAERSQSTLRLAVENLQGALNRYKSIPALIADRADVKRLAENPQDREWIGRINSKFKQIAQAIEASDIYLMNRDGLTISASNFESPKTFIGRNFGFRPYFRSALNGDLGQYFALGARSLRRGYYFAAPVQSSAGVLGVLAVKINIDRFEEAWRGNNYDVIVSDDNGIIFMSSRKDWPFRSLYPLSSEVIESIRDSKQYPVDRLSPLSVSFEGLGTSNIESMFVHSENATEEFIVRDFTISDVGWTVRILSPAFGAKGQAWAAFSYGILSIMLLLLLFAYLAQRRARLFDRIEAQNKAQEQLERRVLERTSELNNSRRKLMHEIEERVATERALRKTQTELIQAGKLAALGQMSAVLSHEFNQPLSAIRSYAENALSYLDLDRRADVKNNLTSITALVERLVAISKHLRNFARKPEEKVRPISLAPVIHDALAIMKGKIKSKNVSISVALPPDELWVKGGQIRLQQVLVNLISNALDINAADVRRKSIEISALRHRGHILVNVRDYGPGIDDENITRIFDPYFTTKRLGNGLGLGLSISYNIIKDFGGRLTAANHVSGGAVFTIELEAALPPERAAA